MFNKGDNVYFIFGVSKETGTIVDIGHDLFLVKIGLREQKIHRNFLFPLTTDIGNINNFFHNQLVFYNFNHSIEVGKIVKDMYDCALIQFSNRKQKIHKNFLIPICDIKEKK